MSAIKAPARGAFGLISDFCGGSNAGKREIEVLCDKIALEHLVVQKRIDKGIPGTPPLLDIPGNPLNESLQRLVFSYLIPKQGFFEERFWGRPTDEERQQLPVLEDMAIGTGIAISRHLIALYRLQQFSHHFFCLCSKDKGSISFYTHWENTDSLMVTESTYDDKELSRILSLNPRRKAIRKLEVRDCPQLFSLRFLDDLPNLEELTLELPQLQNNASTDYSLIKHQDKVAVPRIDCSVLDFSHLRLPRLKKLNIHSFQNLGCIDVRNFNDLEKLYLSLRNGASFEYQGPYFAPKVVDIRGLKCQVQVSPFSIQFQDERHRRYYTENPTQDEDATNEAWLVLRSDATRSKGNRYPSFGRW